MLSEQRNEQRAFDAGVIAALGEYIYALRDPRDNKVFYIGKGAGNRLFDHFNDADAARQNNENWSAKLRRIVEIWQADDDVVWFIIRRGLASDVDSFDIEAAIIDALEISQNGPALNDIGGHYSSARGILSAEDVAALAAPLVNPTNHYSTVFVFPIHNALTTGASVYDATKTAWKIPQHLHNTSYSPLAVGVDKGISKGVFSITGWNQAQISGKWEFNGPQLLNHELDGKNWLTVIGPAKGYWQHGNYLVVEFDGRGKFRFVRGHADKSTWWPL